MSVVHRVNVNFSESAWAALVTLSNETGKTKSDILRDAIALEKWFHEVTTHGGRVLVEHQNGSVREVIPR